MRELRCAAFFPFAAVRGSVPWPEESRTALLNPSWDELRRYAEKAADILPLAPIRIRLAYRLFYLPFEEGAKLLALAAQAGSELLAADFKPAKRNLELPRHSLRTAWPGS